jgi:sugar phosphate isomerase/epimerase
MFAADRSVIVTLSEALDLALQFDAADVGIVVDTFHVWWDPRLPQELARAAGRIAAYHVSDWTTVTGDIAKCRVMMGDGVIELRRIRKGVEESGYSGPIEVEIMNEEIWDRPANSVLEETIQRYLGCV